MFGLHDSTFSDAVKAQLDAQFSFFARLSNQMLDGMQEMNRLNAQASKAMFDQSLAGAKQYLDAMNQMRPGQEQAQNIGTETQAGIARIVDTVIPSPASDATTNEAAKAPEDITKTANQQEDLIEKVAAQMSQASEHSSQSNSRKPAR